MMKKIFTRSHILVFWFVLFLCISAFVLAASRKEEIFSGTVTYLNDGWDVYGDKDNAAVSYVRTIDAELGGKTLGFYTYDAVVEIDIDGRQVYQYSKSLLRLRSPGTGYHYVDIPASAVGGKLTIKIVHVYEEKYDEHYTFEVGRSADLFVGHVKRELLDFWVNVVLLGLSVVLLFLYFLQRVNKQEKKEAFFLGLLTVCFVIWSAENTFIFQFLFPYAIERYYLYYFTLYMLPVLIVCYLETVSEKLDCRWVFWSHSLLMVVLFLLHFLNVAELTQSLVWFFMISAAEMVYVIVRLCMARDISNKVRFYAFLFWIATIFLNTLWYLLNSTKGVSIVLSKFGMCVYIAIIVFQSVKEMINNMAMAKNAELLKVKAYTDNLTGLGNRYAFDEQVREKKLEELIIVSLDVNNLKYYNDNFGHLCGDQLIARTAFIVKSVFDTVYRVGGDEFIAVLTNRSREQMEACRDHVRELAEKGSTEQMKIQIACGYSMYQEGDYSFEDIQRRADAHMYEDKKKLKAGRKPDGGNAREG